MNYNMQKLQLVFGTCIDVLNDLRFKYRDGKLTTFELSQLSGWVDDLVNISNNVKVFEDIYSKLSPADKATLLEWFKSKYNLSPAKAETFIQTLFEFLNVSKNLFKVSENVTPIFEEINEPPITTK